jgi:hypothetical protein
MVPTQAEPMRVLSPAILSDDEIGQMWRVAKSLAASGMFKDVVQAEQAFGRMIVGRDLGLTTAQSLMGLDVVRGNLQMRGTLLGRFVRLRGHGAQQDAGGRVGDGRDLPARRGRQVPGRR